MVDQHRRVGIATVESPSWSGGVASHVEGLTSGLRKLGVQVETQAGVFVERMARFHPFQFVPTLISAARSLRGVDLLHAHDPRLARLGSSLHVPVVTTFHGYMPLEMRVLANGHPNEFLVEACEQFIWDSMVQSDAIITVDNRIGHWLWKEYRARNLHMIPNGVDTERFCPRGGRENDRSDLSFRPRGVSNKARTVEVEAKPTAANPTPRVLFAKAFTPKNGPEVADAAMAIVRREMPEVEYVKTQTTRHEAMPDLIRSCDVVIVPSVPIGGVEEATSCLALEAMSCAKPVVASDIGGLHQLIHPGQTGLLVPPSRPDLLAEAILSLLEDPDLRAYLGERARECVLAHHTWESVARETLKVYESLL